jgi:hypothetical protein
LWFVIKAHPAAHIEICAGGCNAEDGPKDKQDVELFFAEAPIPLQDLTFKSGHLQWGGGEEFSVCPVGGPGTIHRPHRNVFSTGKIVQRNKNLFMVSSFGKFWVEDKNQRKGRNPATGEDVTLSPRRGVTFKCSGKLRKRVKNGQGSFFPACRFPSMPCPSTLSPTRRSRANSLSGNKSPRTAPELIGLGFGNGFRMHGES